MVVDVGRLVANLLRGGEDEIYRKVCAAVDRVVIETVLWQTKGNQVQASKLLGMSRTTLRAKLRSLGMAIEKQLLSGSVPAVPLAPVGGGEGPGVRGPETRSQPHPLTPTPRPHSGGERLKEPTLTI